MLKGDFKEDADAASCGSSILRQQMLDARYVLKLFFFQFIRVNEVVCLFQALDESIEYGQQLVANNPGWIFISPFDDPLIWWDSLSVFHGLFVTALTLVRDVHKSVMDRDLSVIERERW